MGVIVRRWIHPSWIPAEGDCSLSGRTSCGLKLESHLACSRELQGILEVRKGKPNHSPSYVS
jgi:hypothetical protein